MTDSPDFNGLLHTLRGAQGDVPDLCADNPPHAEFPVSEYAWRYARAIRAMEAAGLDALVLTHELNVRYFTGYLTILWESRFRSLMAVLPRDPGLGPTLVVPGQETGNARGTSWVPDRVIYPDQENAVPYLVGALREKGLEAARLGMELGFGQRLGMTQEDFEHFHRAVSGAQVESATPLIQAVRMIKSPAEVARVRRACEISGRAVAEGFAALHEGMTEKELAARLGAAMYREGAELSSRPTFLTVSSYPGRALMVNSLASDHAIERGEMVLLDGGATHGGYATDFIRQACIGPPSDDQRRWFDICIEANDACIDAVKPGVTGADVYEAGIGVFERYGLERYNLINIVGHGTGMEVHELPWLGERDVVYSAETRLEPGMVLCVEPVIAGMDGPECRAGVFIVEDKLLVTEDGCEVLTSFPAKDLWIQP